MCFGPVALPALSREVVPGYSRNAMCKASASRSETVRLPRGRKALRADGAREIRCRGRRNSETREQAISTNNGRYALLHVHLLCQSVCQPVLNSQETSDSVCSKFSSSEWQENVPQRTTFKRNQDSHYRSAECRVREITTSDVYAIFSRAFVFHFSFFFIILFLESAYLGFLSNIHVSNYSKNQKPSN